MHFLLADTDRNLLEDLCVRLEDCGHQVDVAIDANECIDFLRTFLPDALILDCAFCRGSGDDVLARVQADPQLSRITVVIMANTRQELRRLRRPGSVRQVLKPLQPMDLITLPHTVY